MHDVIIIGAGPAGPSAALLLALGLLHLAITAAAGGSETAVAINDALLDRDYPPFTR